MRTGIKKSERIPRYNLIIYYEGKIRLNKENRNIKDSVFVDLFYSYKDAKKNALSLYNALTGSDFHDPDLIEKLKVDGVVYKNFVNDVSFKIGNTIMFFGEHQSTINFNMPLRFLLYAGRIYEKLTQDDDRYKEHRIPLPTPVFYVFYNGTKDYPEYSELRLSNAFIFKDTDSAPDLDVVVHVYNINNGYNQSLLTKCKTLGQYSQFVDIVRKKENVADCYKEAIKECIDRGILSDYLREKGSEVVNMLIAEYNYETDMAVKCKENFEEGEMKERIKMCQELHFSKEDTIENFKKRFSIPEDLANQYVEKYWEK